MPKTEQSWTVLSIDEIVDRYWTEIGPQVRADGHDPDAWIPSHEWLRENDHRTLVYALREHHDKTFREFARQDLGIEDADSDRYEWPTSHEETINALESFLDARGSRGNLSAASVRTYRYRLARYVAAYQDANDTGDLLSPIARTAETPGFEAVDACFAAFDQLHGEVESARTKLRIHDVVDDWYSHLVRHRQAGMNPASSIDEEYRWEPSPSDPVALDASDVQSLAAATTSVRERVLVRALCAWGLRTEEIARLHTRQFVLNPRDGVPRLHFDERKNGPGTVSLLFGVDVLEERIDELATRDDWNGYLFPSDRSRTGHVTRGTILNWFDDLADRADLGTIRGEKPVPKMARRFWYDAYSTAYDDLLEFASEIAAEQGSKSPQVVLEEYLSENRKRELRQSTMQERLAEAFQGDPR